MLDGFAALPQRPPYDEHDGLHFAVGGFSLNSGITFTHAVSDGRTLTQIEVDQLSFQGHRLFFVGTIEYWDSANPPRLRQTAFCRRYHLIGDMAGRFEIIKDPDYEYED